MTDRDGSIELLTFWLPPDETVRKARVKEIVHRLWTAGLDVMVGTAADLAARLHAIEPRVTSFLHLDGFEETRGMIGVIGAVDRHLILPGCLAVWGTVGEPEAFELVPGELQDDLSLAKPAGAAAVPVADVTTGMLKGIVGRLVELVDPPAEPKRRPWWGRLWGQKAGRVN